MKASFDRAIGAVPAPGFDLDAVIRRGRRQDRLRRVSISGAAAATTTAVAVAVVALVSPGTDPVVRNDAGGAVDALQPARYRTPDRTKVSAKGQEQRLRAVVSELLTTYAPDVTYIDPVVVKSSLEPELQARYELPKAAPNADDAPSPVSNQSFEATALLKDRAGISWFRVLVFDFYPDNFAYSCLPKETDCSIRKRGDGSRVYRKSEIRSDNGPPRRVNVVAVEKADGSVAEAESNTDPAARYGTTARLSGKLSQKAGAARSVPQFGTEQLAVIASDPALVLFP